MGKLVGQVMASFQRYLGAAVALVASPAVMASPQISATVKTNLLERNNFMMLSSLFYEVYVKNHC